VLKKCDENGNVVKENGKDVIVEIYKSFAYSEEYNVNVDNELAKENLENLAERAGGEVIADLENPEEVFKGFITSLPKVYDPKTLFMILAIVFFLMDIAVRKFKFKWIHELIREHKAKKESK
jgi:hypothetical protein